MKSLLNTLQKLPGVPAFLIGIVLIFHCTPDPGSVIRSGKTLPPGIMAFLNTAADSQYVVLKTVAKNPKTNNSFLNVEVPLLEKAKVSLSDGSKSFTLEPVYMENPEAPFSLVDGIVRYWACTEPIRPGESYLLKVSIPEKGEFDATTTAPEDFEILSPVNDDTVDVFHPIEVKWTAARGAAGYRVYLWAFREYRYKSINIIRTFWGRGTSNPVIQSSPDTTLLLQHFLDHYYTPPRSTSYSDTLFRAVLTIDALDEPAWTAYCIEKDQHYRDSDFRVDPVSYSNINGGWGLMTATTTKYVELLLPGGQK